ncbi:MAG TPA: hypothetical protein VHY79_12165 [Rhizomicrobium sp.]|jgi:methylmalonyl-CoA mutase|nr:hypothetical protein [Rhizomicrobium sp.]
MSEAALAALKYGAAGNGNLLELAIEAARARARATVGEISDAIESVFGRHQAEIRSVSGVYGSAYEGDNEFAAIRGDVEAFAREEGRRPRILVAKMGQDRHDRGAKIIATAFADLCFDSACCFKCPREWPRTRLMPMSTSWAFPAS